MIFVALDLETTGLDPKTDTIIEIAAIRFELEKKDGRFFVINSEERTMLIDPDRELKEEVTMITGITKEMLEGREKWESVKDRVRDFIGDAIIVGHNVLFDIAMLGTHVIDISSNITLDTFELSEIFSQDVESLNLLFLATHYEIPIEGEHRALDDTRLSVGLFIHYLERILSMSSREKQVFSHLLQKDDWKILTTLFEICGMEYLPGYTLPHISTTVEKNTSNTFHTGKNHSIEYRNLSGEISEEIEIIEQARKEFEKILVVTNGKKQSFFWKEKLEAIGYSAALIIEIRRYCSLNMIQSFIEKTSFNRKELIFSIKMLFWLENTKTGLLDELKYYGEEREWIEFFRLDESEYSPFQKKQEEKILAADILIGDAWIQELQQKQLFQAKSCTIIHDIVELEDIFRKSESQKISFLEIENDLNHLEKNGIISKDLADILKIDISYFQNLVENLQIRPEGPSPTPPGDYGETYYFNQETLWNQGGSWLPIFIDNLQNLFLQEKIFEKEISGIDQKIIQRLLQSIRIIEEISHVKNTNLGIILTILEKNTTLTIIPRDTSGSVQHFLDIQSGDKLILTGYGVQGAIVKEFLKRECQIHWKNDTEERNKTHILQNGKNLFQIIEQYSSIIILSTSNKHIRSISRDIQKRFPDIKVFTQGISGGKGKMLSMYEKYEGRKVLIGLIDSWMNETSIWNHSDTVILAKMPFDPPSDPYYLARTIGMRNNFEEYGCPIAIAKTNTLIGRARNGKNNIGIYCLDDRISETIWGQKLYAEML